MSTFKDRQTIPIVIKGGTKKGIIATAIEIQANSVFQVTEQFQSQPENWLQSISDFSVSYIESLMIGEMGDNLEFCQTSQMTHPLTYRFQDDNGDDIFTITEVASGSNYSLQIAVVYHDGYFEITEGGAAGKGEWTVSLFNTVDAQVYAVEVTDSSDIPVTRLVRMDEADIYLNLEPPV